MIIKGLQVFSKTSFFQMKGAKLVGTGLVLGTLCYDMNQHTNLSQVVNSDSYQVISDRFGNKIAITLCAISLVGGAAYCIYKYLTKQKAQTNSLEELSPEELLKKLEAQDAKELAWQISSISTNSALDTYGELRCEITNQLMVEPASLSCGHQFSRKAIQEWLNRSDLCPKCRKSAKKSDLRVSLVTAKTIQRFKKRLIKKGQEWVKKRIAMDFQTQVDASLKPKPQE